MTCVVMPVKDGFFQPFIDRKNRNLSEKGNEKMKHENKKKNENLRSFYFTFGQGQIYPPECRGSFVVVVATSFQEAFRIFRCHYPDRERNILNCADYYSREEWVKLDYYKGMEPAAIFADDADYTWAEVSTWKV